MTYFADGEAYDYLPDDPGLVCAGWLDAAHPFSTGDPSPGFVDRLAWRCVYAAVAKTRGSHDCDLCPPKAGGVPPLLVAGRQHFLGSAEIRVKTPGATYAAPDLVLHYVVAHRYLPPDDFVEAVLAAPESESLAGWSFDFSPTERGWVR